MTPPLAEQVGARLRRARHLARYSGSEAARFCRVGEAKLLAWEAGKLHPSAEELGRFCRVVGLPPDRLVPPAVFAAWSIDASRAAAIYGAAAPPPPPRRTGLKGLAAQAQGRWLPLRCDTCGRWFSTRACVHRRRAGTLSADRAIPAPA